MIHTNKNKEINCLKTGDLGFLYEKNLYVTGRKKDLIIHHGKNYYPQDIEYIAETSSSEIRRGCSAAFLDETTEDIILVIETYHPKNEEEINQKICEEIKENVFTALDITLRTIILIYPSSISKTTSGKIQRNQVKKQYENQELRRVYTYE
jgi:acyl-CoA synthetase (AMP-forming)/AMP-acid ligase II